MLMNLVFFIMITVLLTRYRLPVGPPAWSGKGRIAALVISAYMIIAPFFLPALIRRSTERMLARGTDPDGLLALTGIGGAMAPVACGLFLVVFGDRVIFLQAGLLVSLVATGYWYWRARAAFPIATPNTRPAVRNGLPNNRLKLAARGRSGADARLRTRAAA